MIKDNFNLLETEGLFSGSDKKYLYEIKDSISHDERAKEIFNKLINDEYKNLRIRRKRKRLKLLFLSCILIILLGVGVFTGLAGMFNLMEFIFPLWLLYLLINEISENSLFFGCLVYSISGDEEKYLNDVIDDGMKEETFEPIIRGNSVYIEKDGKIMDVTNQVKVEMSNLIHIGYKNKIKIGKYDVYENRLQKIYNTVFRYASFHDEEKGLKKYDEYIVIDVQKNYYGIDKQEAEQ